MRVNSLFFLITLSVFVAERPARAQAEQRVSIGVSTALSGPAASFGTDIKNAVEFANDYFTGGQYQIVVEDDHCSSRDAVAVAHKLVSFEHVRAVFGNCSATVLSAAPIYEKTGVLLLAPLASSPQISRLGQNIIRTIPSDADAAKLLFQTIASSKRSLGVLTEESDYSVDFFSAFAQQNTQQQLVIFPTTFPSTENDFRTRLLILKRERIDSLFINSNTEESFVRILHQARALHLAVPIYGALIPGSATFRKLAGHQADGLTYVDFPQNESNLTPEGAEIYRAFVNRYGQPLSWDISFATTFEAFRVMHEILQSGQTPADYRNHHNFSGLFGQYSFTENGDIVGLSPTLQQIVDGQVQTVEVP